MTRGHQTFRFTVVLTSAYLAIWVLPVGPLRAQATDPVDYLRDVKPILRQRCFSCHGAKEQQGGLRVDTATMIQQGGDGGTAIEAGEAAKSLLIERLLADDESERMPAEGPPLSARQIEILVRWINDGAHSPDDERPQADPLQHWAFQPLTRPAFPAVEDTTWIRNPIDRFVWARLQRASVAPSPEARRTTLIRRLYLDLLGLPPDPSEVDTFLLDPSPDSYEQLVDRLLSSPAFGERWGRHWLDLARYADSNGYEDDALRPDAWRFRDWVIGAYNSDMPFDRFTILQLAGDRLPDAGFDEKVATGFHRMTLSNDGGADTVEEEFRIIAAKDRADTTGSVWLGLSIGCAKCHAHKYDPITQREYYQLFAFFNNATDTAIDASALPQRYRDEYQLRLKAFNHRLAAVRQRIKDYEDDALPAVIEQWASSEAFDAHVHEQVLEHLSVPAPGRSQKSQLQLGVLLAQIDPQYGDAMGNELLNSGNNRPLPPSVRALTLSVEPRESRVHRRGNFLDPGERVEPGTPDFLPPLKTSSPRQAQPDRWDLARWIVGPRNPLAGRVAANHVWLQLFGRGLVATADDFGLNGSPPSHPALLDWLAVEFRQRGWSRKALIRLVVTSATYRQSSRATADRTAQDPDNLLLARQNRRRLEAECVRDVTLAAAGILNRQVGGPSFQPPLPSGLADLDELKNERFLETSVGVDRYRRGLYIQVQRMFVLPMLQTFDVADPNTSCARRERSNSPLQALTLLNDPAFFEAAQALGRRMQQESGSQLDPQQRIRFAVRVCLARDPDVQELQALGRLWREQLAYCHADPDSAVALLGRLPLTEGADLAEAAACVGLARALLNLDEFITRE